MRPTKGLTLIELAVALAIVSLLMSAVLATVVHLSRAEAANSGRVHRTAAAESVKQVLAQDIEHAGSWRPDATGFSLMTLGTLRDEDLELSHRPAEVSYEVKRIGSRSYLVRTQRAAGRQPLAELVSPDVSSLTPNLQSLGPANSPRTWMPVPATFNVSVTFEDGALGAQGYSFHTGGTP